MSTRILAVALLAPWLALAHPAPVAAGQTNFSFAIGIPGIPFFGAAVGVPGPYYAPPPCGPPAYVSVPVYAPVPVYVPGPAYGGPVYYGARGAYAPAYRPYGVRGYHGHGYRRW